MKTALLILIGVVIGASLMVAPFTKKLIEYLRPTIEGEDGKASMKRITIFLFVVLFVVAFLGDLAFDKTVGEHFIDILAIVILGGIGLTSGHTIATAFVNKKKPTTDQPPMEEGQVQQQHSER